MRIASVRDIPRNFVSTNPNHEEIDPLVAQYYERSPMERYSPQPIMDRAGFEENLPRGGSGLNYDRIPFQKVKVGHLH